MERVKSSGTWTMFSHRDTVQLSSSQGAEFRQLYSALEATQPPGSTTCSATHLWTNIMQLQRSRNFPSLVFRDPLFGVWSLHVFIA